MTYTADRPAARETSEQLRARIPGWGVDLDPAGRGQGSQRVQQLRPTDRRESGDSRVGRLAVRVQAPQEGADQGTDAEHAPPPVVQVVEVDGHDLDPAGAGVARDILGQRCLACPSGTVDGDDPPGRAQRGRTLEHGREDPRGRVGSIGGHVS